MGGPQEHQLLTAAELVEAITPTIPRIHVTGATGWFGRTALDLLRSSMPPDEFSERVLAYASRHRRLPLGGGLVVEAQPLDHLARSVASGDVVAHFAYRTREQADADPEAYIVDNVRITTEVIRAIEAQPLRGVFVTSSGAVYGRNVAPSSGLDTDPYGTLKRLDELAFRGATVEHGTSCAVARVFAVSGPFMTKPERYALGDLITQVAAGGTVRIKATRRVVRAYSAVADIVAVGLAAAARGSGTYEVFDSGGQEVEIGDLAEMVAAALDRPPPTITRPAPTDAEDRYLSADGSFDAIAERFGLQQAPLDHQIRATAGDLLGRDRAPDAH